jgi:glycine C-acetyltransferase
MPSTRLQKLLLEGLDALAKAGRLKGAESVIRAVVPGRDGFGPRYLLEGEGERAFLRMNANNYLGMALHAKVRAAEEEATQRYGTGPGAVRFISGTWAPHTALERRLADFHGRADAMLFSSAYAAIMGVLPPLITARTAVISDSLNHNSIINAIALARPAEKRIFPHLDLAALERHLTEAARSCVRAIVVTDGVFSMRGDHAALRRMRELVDAADAAFPENALLIVDDSHGVGAFGPTGRGTEEVTLPRAADVLIATLGKAFGVNGGYAVADGTVVRYLRETSPFYVYSNPITPGEAAAALAALATLDSAEGLRLLAHLQAMTRRFRRGLAAEGLESLPGEHPIVPLMVRDGVRTARIVAALRREGVLVTGLSYPVVPQGEEEIRLQISVDHTPADIDAALQALARVAPH